MLRKRLAPKTRLVAMRATISLPKTSAAKPAPATRPLRQRLDTARTESVK
jgi:hypothetical protein